MSLLTASTISLGSGHLEGQLGHGLDPEAIIDYGIGLGSERITRGHVRGQLQDANIQRLSVAAAGSRQHLIAVRDGKKMSKRTTPKKIDRISLIPRASILR